MQANQPEHTSGLPPCFPVPFSEAVVSLKAAYGRIFVASLGSNIFAHKFSTRCTQLHLQGSEAMMLAKSPSDAVVVCDVSFPNNVE